jgi:hypothetical protein
MTNNDEFSDCDKHAAARTMSPLNMNETSTESSCPPADRDIFRKEVLTQQCSSPTPSATVAEVQPDELSKDDESGDDECNNEMKSRRTTTILSSPTAIPINHYAVVDTEQSHTKRGIPFAKDESSYKKVQRKQQLDKTPSIRVKGLANRYEPKHLSDSDLMDVLEHCFDGIDFASIPLHESSSEDVANINTLKEIFDSQAKKNTIISKDASLTSEDVKNTNDERYLKSHHLRKRRFLKHLIQQKSIRIRLERMMHESATIERFLVSKNRKRIRGLKEQTSTHPASATLGPSPILSDDRSSADDRPKRCSMSDDDCDSDSKRTLGSKESYNNHWNDIDARDHLNKFNNQDNEHKTFRVSNGLANGDGEFKYCNKTFCISNGLFIRNSTFKHRNEETNNTSIVNQDSDSFSALEEPQAEILDQSNSEHIVHTHEGNEHNDLRASNDFSTSIESCFDEKDHSAKSSSDNDEEGSASMHSQGSLSTGCGSRIYDGPIDSDEIYDQMHSEEECTTLLRSPQDQHKPKRISSDPLATNLLRHPETTKKADQETCFDYHTEERAISNNKQTKAPFTNGKDNSRKRIIIDDAGQLFQATNDMNYSSETTGESDDIDHSGSSSIGSFEIDDLDAEAFPFFAGKVEESGGKTKLTSVTMEDDSVMTCYSREVSMGDSSVSASSSSSSSDGGSNLMESSISRIVKTRGEKIRAQQYYRLFMLAILFFAIIGIFALGVFLGYLKYVSEFSPDGDK